jgi:predicted signal transduction protein with EAL and GGDEF domain
MKIRVSHPDLAPDLVDALNQTDCLAARVGSDVVEVIVPWLTDGADLSQAATELSFFVRAWGAAHPQLRATVLDLG